MYEKFIKKLYFENCRKAGFDELQIKWFWNELQLNFALSNINSRGIN